MTQESKLENLQSIIEEKMLMMMEDVEFLRQSGLTWVESVIQYCEDCGIEVEDVIPMISPTLMTKLHDEGVTLKTIKGTTYPKLM